MNILRLSTAAGVEGNRAALLAHLTSLCGAGPVGEPSNPLHVHLRVDDGRRDTLLRHVKELYDAALQHHPETFVSVIPLSTPSNCGPPQLKTSNDSDNSFSLFTSNSMTADRGFDPIYRHVAVGGTFDQLHAGHKLLLTTAMFYATKTLRVGVTQEELLTKKSHGAYIEPFETRCATVSRFLSFLRRDIDVDVTGITEPSGGTDRIAEVEALVVSPETASAVGTINVARASHGLPPMQSVEISYVDVDNDKHISSTELRRRLHERRQGTN